MHKVVISNCRLVLYVCPVITPETLDWFASNFDRVTPISVEYRECSLFGSRISGWDGQLMFQVEMVNLYFRLRWSTYISGWDGQLMFQVEMVNLYFRQCWVPNDKIKRLFTYFKMVLNSQHPNLYFNEEHK